MKRTTTSILNMQTIRNNCLIKSVFKLHRQWMEHTDKKQMRRNFKESLICLKENLKRVKHHNEQLIIIK